MEVINETRKVEVEVEVPVTSYKFETRDAYHFESLTITDGEIVEIFSQSATGHGTATKSCLHFDNTCRSAIRFIVKHDLKELKNIYNALSEGPMKDFCRELQKEKMKELEF